MRLNLEPHGTFKILYSPTLHHSSLCYYSSPYGSQRIPGDGTPILSPELLDNYIIDFEEICPGAKPNLFKRFNFGLKCIFVNFDQRLRASKMDFTSTFLDR
jgi:hypothetical protein